MQRKKKEFINKKKEMLLRNKKATLYDSRFNYRNVFEIPSLFRNFKINRLDLVLEVGAGTGRITTEFVKRGAEVVALDYSIDSLKINKARCGCHIILADLCYLPFKSSVFDKAAGISVFQFISTPQSRLKGFKEIWRVLKKEARFLITVYNNQLLDRLCGSGKEGYHSDIIYYYKFDFFEFKYILSSLFSKITDIRGIYILPYIKIPKLASRGFIVRKIGTKAALFLENLVEKTFLSFLLGDHILAICKK